MLVIYDTLNKGEYPYIDGTFTFGEYGTSLVPIRGFLLKGKNFDVYKYAKSDLRESILSRVHKNDDVPAPLVVTTEVGINNDYADKGLLVLFTTDGAMMVTPTEKGYKLFLKFGDDVFIVDKEGFRPAQDEEKANVHWFTVNQLKQGINADEKIVAAISRNDGWEEYFTYKFHINEEGGVRVRSAHNFMGGIMVDTNGKSHNETLWDWYVLSEDGRRRMLKSSSSHYYQYCPDEELIDEQVKESDYSVVKSAFEEYREKRKAEEDNRKAQEEAVKVTKSKARRTKSTGEVKTSDGRTKASKAAAAAFLAAVSAISSNSKEA